VLVGISTSGNSANVVAAFEAARAIGIQTIALTGGGGGKMATLADVLINAPSLSTPRIQELHISIGHTICELIEDALA
jgi:D-sedoheptulose 7-phosphate isomerase